MMLQNIAQLRYIPNMPLIRITTLVIIRIEVCMHFQDNMDFLTLYIKDRGKKILQKLRVQKIRMSLQTALGKISCFVTLTRQLGFSHSFTIPMGCN